MGLKLYEAKKTMAEIGEVISQNEARMIQAMQSIAVAKAELEGMVGRYGPFITALDAAAAANPGNVVWEQLKAQKELYVAEFGVLKTYASDLDTAANGVAKP